MPPHRLGDLSRATFSNIEQQSLEFVIHSLRPWLVRIERAIENQLLTDKDRENHLFRFKIEGLLRGDSAARSAFYREMFNIGVLSRNDIRELEDLNPIDGGDETFIPLNMGVASRVIAGEPEKPPEQPPQNNGDLAQLTTAVAGVAVAQVDLKNDLARIEHKPIAQPAAQPKTDSSKSQRAAEAVLRETLGRFLKKSANESRRAASRNPNQFIDFIETHLAGWESKLASACLAQVHALLIARGAGTDQRSGQLAMQIARQLTLQMAERFAKASKADLLSACECKSAELEKSVADCVDLWTHRNQDLGI